MEVPTFKAKCAACSSEFAYPEFSDFSYGDFLFVGVNGGVFAHFTAPGHPVSELVTAALPSGASFPAVCAAVADPIEGQALVAKRQCPTCHSSRWEYWQGERVGSITASQATFSGFLSLPKAEQDSAVHLAATMVTP